MSTFYADYTKYTIKVVNNVISENYRGGGEADSFSIWRCG